MTCKHLYHPCSTSSYFFVKLCHRAKSNARRARGLKRTHAPTSVVNAEDCTVPPDTLPNFAGMIDRDRFGKVLQDDDDIMRAENTLDDKVNASRNAI